MIKNVIFDIGNVLATFKPQEFLMEFFQDEQIVEDLYHLFFKTDLWNQYDQGLLNGDTLKQKAIARMPQYQNEIESMIPAWTSYVRPIESSVDLVRFCQEKGLKTFILSNIPQDCHIYFQKHYGFFDQMDGGIWSYQDHLIKPDPKIYELLLSRYALKAQECLFIDDHIENLVEAQKHGIHTIHCTHVEDLPQQVKRFLYEMQCQ